MILTPDYQDDVVVIYHADCRDILPLLSGVDAVATDPPYELGFMGKAWDKKGVSFQSGTWKVILDTCKPGAHLLAFGGTRTFHRMACAIEDAGWEIRDTVMWVYGQGFPKSLDISKQIDKMAGVKREVVGMRNRGDVERGKSAGVTFAAAEANKGNKAIFGYGTELITAPTSEAAKEWQGWGTGLKPAWEPIILARKPIYEKTVAENVLKWGTGAINIDDSRISYLPEGDMESKSRSRIGGTVQGRFPANLIHDGSDEVLAEFAKAGGKKGFSGGGGGATGTFKMGKVLDDYKTYNDSGTAARFFYCAKASRAERDKGLEDMPLVRGFGKNTSKQIRRKDPDTGEEKWFDYKPDEYYRYRNTHPTVKPLALMRYLIKLVTPLNGIILDPFMGSGSTLLAAKQLGFKAIGIDTEKQYCAIAVKRLEAIERYR